MFENLARSEEWAGLASVANLMNCPDGIVIGVPFEGGAGGAGGASRGPAQVRVLSTRAKTIDRRGRDFSRLRLLDVGDVATWRFDLDRTVEHVNEVYRRLFAVAEVPVLSIGGDHSVTNPIVRAAGAGRRLGLVWFDAHPDVLDDYQGSDVSHGSPLRRILDDGAVRAEDVLLVGTRAYDPGEPEYLRQVGVRELQAADICADPGRSIAEFSSRATSLADRVDQIYVSIDIDVLDAAYVPGTGTPVAAGIQSSILISLLEAVPEPVLAYDVVEFAPAHDVAGTTGSAVMAIITAILSRIEKTDGGPEQGRKK